MGEGHLIDTNVIIDFLSQKLPYSGKVFVASLIDESFITSFICKIEVLSYRFETESEQNTTKRFIEQATIFGLTDAIIDKTISIRQNGTLKLPDALIAATAMTYDLTIISRNMKDFARVDGLRVINPHTL